MIETSFKLPEKIFGLETSLIKMFVFPTVVVILFLVTVFQVILPKVEEVNEIRGKTTEVDKKTKVITEKKNYFANVDQAELKRNSDYVSRALVKEKNAYLLVNIIRKVAEKYGFQVSEFSVSPGKLGEGEVQSTKKDFWLEMPVRLSLIGQKSRYVELMLGFENHLPILSVRNFEMKTVGDLAELQLTISSYYVNEKIDAANVANLSLPDLTLNKTEQELLGKIQRFEIIDAGVDENGEDSRGYVKYERVDPFNL